MSARQPPACYNEKVRIIMRTSYIKPGCIPPLDTVSLRDILPAHHRLKSSQSTFFWTPSTVSHYIGELELGLNFSVALAGHLIETQTKPVNMCRCQSNTLFERRQGQGSCERSVVIKDTSAFC
jgi:hypothetical protein